MIALFTTSLTPVLAGSPHTVVSGESLYLIARSHGTTVAALREANGLTSDLLQIGQKLTIPGSGATSTKVPPRTSGDEELVLRLARITAAEAGGDALAGTDAKVAVAAAMLNYVRSKVKRKVTAIDVDDLLAREPWYLSSIKEPVLAPLYRRDLAWFESHGYSGAVAAARAAVAGQDPSYGADHWFDNSISNPYPDTTIVTATYPCGKKRIVFYKFKPGYS